MFTADNYECTWDLFKTIPTLTDPDKTVYEEIIEFNERVKAHSNARLVDRNRSIVDTTTMGFSMKDRVELLKLTEAEYHSRRCSHPRSCCIG
jgi:oleate hydratase